jgi:hypothetical protein
VTVETVSTEILFDQAVLSLGTYAEQGTQKRVFFDDLMGWLQLEIERDESGKVLSATRAGQPISTSNAIRIENQLKRASFFWDVQDRVFRGRGLDSINKADLSDAVSARVEEMIAAGEVDASIEIPWLAASVPDNEASTE